MMKLSTMKRIVNTVDEDWNSSFAESIAGLWGYDEETVKYFRSSANFLFFFQREGKDYFLRFNSSEERTRKNIEDEINIIKNLNKRANNIVKAIKSKNDNYVESIDTELGTYHAVVFERMKGKQYEIEELDLEQYFNWGKALGQLHKETNNLSEKQRNKRDSCEDHIVFIEENLSENEVKAKAELNKIKNWIKGIEITENNYGLIHFDFELDNLLWEEDKINIIDFDDSSNYWYVADIAFAMRDLFEEGIDLDNKYYNKFISGYESEFEIDKALLDDLEWFMRLHDLYTFTKLLRTVDVSDSNEQPEWLLNLRNKLLGVIDNYRDSF